MPRVGVECPVDGARISDEVCIACRTGAPRAGKHCHYTYEQLKGMTDDSGRETAYVSGTMLGGPCPRQTWLKARKPWYLDPDAGHNAFRGQIGHLMMEQHPEPGAVYEQRFEMTLPDGRIVTGQLDKIHFARKEITDGKTKGEDKELPEKPDIAYDRQLNFYRYLAWHGSPQKPITHDGTGLPLVRAILPGRPAHIEITSLYLNYWTFKHKGSRLIPVPLRAEADTLAYILSGAATQYADEPPPIPPRMDPAGMRGKVSTFCALWCPVRRHCLELLLDE